MQRQLKLTCIYLAQQQQTKQNLFDPVETQNKFINHSKHGRHQQQQFKFTFISQKSTWLYYIILINNEKHYYWSYFLRCEKAEDCLKGSSAKKTVPLPANKDSKHITTGTGNWKPEDYDSESCFNSLITK